MTTCPQRPQNLAEGGSGSPQEAQGRAGEAVLLLEDAGVVMDDASPLLDGCAGD